jgi:hydroxymethylpyrimidine/phosphomethylpyrimidine kinase
MRSTTSAHDGIGPAPIALTIAGSDSGGGAGIQADLKTFSALGAYGCSVITALTAQNTLGVQAIHAVDPAFVRSQMDSVLGDLSVRAVKIGMLGTPEVVAAVADGLLAWRPPLVVLDPVMVAKGGDRLLRDEAVAAVRERLLPLAFLITPNLPEAGALLGGPGPADRGQMGDAARRLRDLGPANVLLKGGHLVGNDSPDLLLADGTTTWLEAPRIATRHTHGTGCTLSSAIAALLAHGRPLPVAVAEAKRWLSAAIGVADRLAVGHGIGPVHHFHAIWRGVDTAAGWPRA